MLVLLFLRGSVVLLLALLSASSKTKYQMKGRLFLNVVIRKGPAIFQLLSSEDQTLLVWRDALFVLKSGQMLKENSHGFLHSCSNQSFSGSIPGLRPGSILSKPHRLSLNS